VTKAGRDVYTLCFLCVTFYKLLACDDYSLFIDCVCQYVCIHMYLIHVQQAVVDVPGVCDCVMNRSKEWRPRQVHSMRLYSGKIALIIIAVKKKFGVIKFFWNIKFTG
jgi:hypothetical protein